MRVTSPHAARSLALGVAFGAVLGAVLVGVSGRAPEARASAGPVRPALAALPSLPAGPASPLDGAPVAARAPVVMAPVLLSPPEARRLDPGAETRIVERARAELDRVTVYDSRWHETSGYPMGDIPASRGACTDVVVRSLRAAGIDLQELVHRDMQSSLSAYGATHLDRNIDHRRLGTMFTFFERNALSLTHDAHDREEFRPGDVVFYAWTSARGAPPEHVGVVSDRVGPRGLPLLIQNGGPRPKESDTLDHGHIVGHFRVLPRTTLLAPASLGGR